MSNLLPSPDIEELKRLRQQCADADTPNEAGAHAIKMLVMSGNQVIHEGLRVIERFLLDVAASPNYTIDTAPGLQLLERWRKGVSWFELIKSLRETHLMHDVQGIHQQPLTDFLFGLQDLRNAFYRMARLFYRGPWTEPKYESGTEPQP